MQDVHGGEEVDGEEGGAAPRPIGQTGIVPTVPSMDNPMKRMGGFQSYLHRSVLTL